MTSTTFYRLLFVASVSFTTLELHATEPYPYDFFEHTKSKASAKNKNRDAIGLFVKQPSKLTVKNNDNFKPQEGDLTQSDINKLIKLNRLLRLSNDPYIQAAKQLPAQEQPWGIPGLTITASSYLSSLNQNTYSAMASIAIEAGFSSIEHYSDVGDRIYEAVEASKFIDPKFPEINDDILTLVPKTLRNKLEEKQMKLDAATKVSKNNLSLVGLNLRNILYSL